MKLIPKTQKTYLLNLLINKKEVSEIDFNINGYRARLSELENKHGIVLKETWHSGKNRFGRGFSYKSHSIPKECKADAKQILKQLLTNKK